MIADVPDAWQWEATAAHRTLVERDDAGHRLLRESGPLASIALTARPAWAGAGRLEFSAALAAARLDYAGRTQAGAPLDTTSRHLEVQAGARWRPLSAFAWGEPSVTFDALWFRRSIAGTVDVARLRETSTLAMPGVAWTTPTWSAGDTKLAVEARWRTSVHHRLQADYDGIFDPSTLHGGRRNEASLGATALTAGGWSWRLEWRHATQAQSELAPLFRAGAPAGTVRQPRMVIDDVGLSLSRNF